MAHPAKWDKAPINFKKAFRIHLLVFLLTVPAQWLIWYFNRQQLSVAIMDTAAWATGLLFHYLGVYVLKKKQTN